MAICNKQNIDIIIQVPIPMSMYRYLFVDKYHAIVSNVSNAIVILCNPPPLILYRFDNCIICITYVSANCITLNNIKWSIILLLLNLISLHLL